LKEFRKIASTEVEVEDFMPTKAGSKTTVDHDEIRSWAEERKAEPACVRGTGGKGDIGMLRLDFPGYSGEQSLEHISWDEWFDKFDEQNLALIYQDTTAAGEKSNFNKLVSRETAESAAPKRASASTPRRTGRVSAASTRAAKKPAAAKKATAASHTRSASAKRTGTAKRTAASTKRAPAKTGGKTKSR
jgi:hypothetical protein